MDDFYIGPLPPLWLAFVITVLLMALGFLLLMQMVRVSLPPEMQGTGAALIAISTLWMPVWFIYGVLTMKFH